MLKYISIIGIAASVALLYNSSFKRNIELRQSIGVLANPLNDTRLKEPGTLHWTHLSKETFVSDGDTVFTGENSSSVVKFKDHSEIRINENSIVIFSNDMIELEQGSLDINYNQHAKKRLIKVGGKTHVLDKPGTFKIQNISNIEFIPRDTPAPEVQVASKQPAPIQFQEPRFTPRRLLAETDQKSPLSTQISVPSESETLSEDPHEISVPASSETLPEKKERKWTLYGILSRGSQKNEIAPTVNGTSIAKSYSVSGNSVTLRAEVENLASRPLAVSMTANDYSGNSSKFKSHEVSAEVIVKNKHRTFKDVVLMPGLHLRQYTFTVDKFQPTDVESSEIDSRSLMVGLSGRWEKNFDSWVAEIWPQIKMHSKSEFLLDYSLLGGVGRETRIGRFSLYIYWRRFDDNLSIQEADGDTEVEVTETRLGGGYVYRF